MPERFCPESNVTLFSVLVFEPQQTTSIAFKSAPDPTFNHSELEMHRTSLKMTKNLKRLHEFQWSTAVFCALIVLFAFLGGA